MGNNTKPHRPFKLSPYDPSWPKLFEAKKKLILEVMGDTVLNVYHIGSTSIPNMIAKTQIDIMVEVKDLDDVRDKTVVDKMAKNGFTSRGDYIKVGEEYFTEDNEEGKRITSVHTLPQGHPKIDSILAFRNHILNNKEDRELYINTKKELYAKYANNYHKYDSGK